VRELAPAFLTTDVCSWAAIRALSKKPAHSRPVSALARKAAASRRSPKKAFRRSVLLVAEEDDVGGAPSSRRNIEEHVPILDGAKRDFPKQLKSVLNHESWLRAILKIVWQVLE